MKKIVSIWKQVGLEWSLLPYYVSNSGFNERAYLTRETTVLLMISNKIFRPQTYTSKRFLNHREGVERRAEYITRCDTIADHLCSRDLGTKCHQMCYYWPNRCVRRLIANISDRSKTRPSICRPNEIPVLIIQTIIDIINCRLSV